MENTYFVQLADSEKESVQLFIRELRSLGGGQLNKMIDATAE